MLKRIALSILISFSINTFSYSSELSDNLTEIVFSDKEINRSNLGIQVFNLNKNKYIYSYNSNNYFIPASNMKILTTLISLEYLGQNFQFETKLKTDYINKNTVNNLYLELSSDPLFSNKNLATILNELKNRGINKINNNIYIYNNKIDNKIYGKGWMYDDFDDCYSSPIGKYIIDKNCLNIKISDSLNIESNNLIDFTIIPYNDYFKVFNFDLDNLNLLYGGKPIKNYNYELSIKDPQKYLEKVFLKYLDKNNIEFNGKIIFDTDNKDNIEIYNYKSIPLKDILKIFNKESDNLIGEILLKTVSSVKNKEEGNTNNAIDIEKKYLEENFNHKNFIIADGSGLSRYNILSPNIIVDILKKIYNSNYKKTVLDAFPIGGEEGTIKNRLKNIDKDFKIIAKTGSMSGINCISGYIISEKNDNIAFSIMINNSLETPKDLMNFQDKIIETIVRTLH